MKANYDQIIRKVADNNKTIKEIYEKQMAFEYRHGFVDGMESVYKMILENIENHGGLESDKILIYIKALCESGINTIKEEEK